jgi:hypothetical protein
LTIGRRQIVGAAAAQAHNRIREFAHSAEHPSTETRVMSANVLVASASRHGATDELARMRRPCPRQRGVLGRWTPEARAFVDQHEGGIMTRPTWLFSSGPIGDLPAAESFDADELMRMTGAREHHLFGGRLLMSSLGFRERAFARLLHVPAGDYREWAAAAAWATAIARTLVEEQAA